MRYFPRRMAGANGITTAATGLADLWPFECAAAAAKLAPGWNKKKCLGLLTNGISLYIFGYIRGGNSAAVNKEGKQMITLDYNFIKYTLEHAAKKMDDYIKEVEAMDAPAIVKNMIIENHEDSKRKILSMLEKFDNGLEDNLLLMTDEEYNNFIEQNEV